MIQAISNLKLVLIVPLLIALLLPAGVAVSQDNAEPANPGPANNDNANENPEDNADDEAGPAQLKATIIGTAGAPQIREPGEERWKPARVRMVVPVGTEFYCPPRAKLQFKIPPDQVITIDRSTRGVIVRAERINEGEVETHIAIRTGRVLYQVKDSKVKHNARLTSPSAGHYVRGTEGLALADEPNAPPQVVAFGNELSTFITPLGFEVQIDSQGQIVNMSGDFNSLANYLYVNSNSDAGTARTRDMLEAFITIVFQGSLGPDRQRIAAAFGNRKDFEAAKSLVSSFIGVGVPSGDTVATISVINRNTDVDLHVVDANGVHLATFTGIDVNDVKKAAGGRAGPDVKGGGTEYVVYAKTSNRPIGNMTVEAVYFQGPATDVVLQLKVKGQPVQNTTVNVGPLNLRDSAVFNVPAP